MVKCCVSGCDETDHSGTELTFFKFPKTRLMKQKWLDVIRPRARLTAASVVCSQHFLPGADYQRVDGRDVLKSCVVPSVFNTDLKQTNNKKHTRRKQLVSPKPSSGEESDDDDDDKDSNVVDNDEENSVTSNDKCLKDGEASEKSDGKDCDENSTKDSENGPVEADASAESSGKKCDEKITNSQNNCIKDSDESRECNKKNEKDEKMENNEVKGDNGAACRNNGEGDEIEGNVDDKMGQYTNSSCESLTNGRKSSNEPLSSLNGDVTSKCGTEVTDTEDKTAEHDNKEANTESETELTNVDRTDEIDNSKTNDTDNVNETAKLDTSIDTEESNKMKVEDSGLKIDERIETESNPDYDELIRETQCKIMEMSEEAVPILDNVETILEEDESSKHSVVDLDKNLFDESSKPSIEDVDENIFEESSKGAEPVFVEISIDPHVMGSPSPPESPTDCMMIVENVQVDVDPSTLMASMEEDERAADDDDDDDVQVIERKEEPVSLLTSSDDDDVILEEPHIDTVELSDETSEDDMPLTRYMKKTTKQQKEWNEKLKNIFWGTGSEFYCYSCSYTTKSKRDLSEHIKTHDKTNQKVQKTSQRVQKTSQIMVCDVCDYQSPSEHQFARHKRKHKDDKKHKCHMCDYKARHKMSLVYHMKSHKGVEKVVYKCNKCSYQSAGPLALQRHTKAMHTKVVIQCEKCSFTCRKKINLQRHVRSAHVKRKKHNKKGSSSSGDEDYVPGKDV